MWTLVIRLDTGLMVSNSFPTKEEADSEYEKFVEKLTNSHFLEMTHDFDPNSIYGLVTFTIPASRVMSVYVTQSVIDKL